MAEKMQQTGNSHCTRRGLAVLALLGSLVSAGHGEERRRLRPLPKLDRNVKTGPAIGARIPGFKAVDQNGKKQSFDTLRGPKGLVLLFVRSADW